MNIYERIKQRRLQLGLSAEEVAEALKISRATMYRYEGGQIEKMPVTIIGPLSEILDISPIELLGLNEPVVENGKRIPLVGCIACGSPIMAEENIEDYVTAPLDCDADFALRCKGDSMIRARICDGDIVFIHAQSDCSNGEIAAVLIGDEATLKRVYKQKDSITLMPENSEYSPLVFSREELNEIRILGKAVGFISYF